MTIEAFATQSGASYGAELTRRAIFAGYARTGANTPGLVAGGLVSSADLQLSAPASGMSVNVSVGEAIVGGTSGAAQGGYYFRNTAQANISVAAANPSNPRVDAVVATVADAGYSQPSDVGGTTNGGVLAVVTGTATAGATLTNLSGAPAVPLSSLLLGYVLVPAASTNVTTGNISNVAALVSLLPGNVLHLATAFAGTRKVNWGQVNVTFSGSSAWSSTATVPHGLGTTPSAVHITAIDNVEPMFGGCTTPDATNIYPWGYTPSVTLTAGSNRAVYWLAIG